MNDNFRVKIINKQGSFIEKNMSDGNHEMPFLLKIGSNLKVRKALFILHGHGANKSYAKFHSDEWIVVCPLDIYGTDGLGSWWLGENGDFFTFRLLQSLILNIKKEYDLEEVYFWGSSMGGYGSLLHGTICNADAVYAHMPQVKLAGTDYTDGLNAKFYEPIFSGNDSTYKDLTTFLSNIDVEKTPVYFLSQNVFDYPNYVAQHFIPLIRTLDAEKMAYSVEMNLEEGHKVFRNIASTVENIFDKNIKKINDWNNSRTRYIQDLLTSIEVDILCNGNVIQVVQSTKINSYVYACYLYLNNKVVEKNMYQKNSSFTFTLDREPMEGDIIGVKYYLRSTVSKDLRLSKNYSLKYSEGI